MGDAERGCGGCDCILAREAGGQVVGMCRCLPRSLDPEDRMRLAREITAQRDELRALRRARDVRAPGPQHERGGVREALRVSAPVDPWAVLRAIRELPWLSETDVPDGEECYISGADAVDELHRIRVMVDEALQGAPGGPRDATT